MWGNLKKITNKLKQNPLRIIKFKNKWITSINDITNITHNHHKDKTYKIREKFTDNRYITPIQILEYLIPKSETTFKLPLPTEKHIAKIIKKAKSTFSVGNDINNLNTSILSITKCSIFYNI